MKCNKCGMELRIEQEQIGSGDIKYSTTIGYCDKCKIRYDLSKEKWKTKHSPLSIASLVLTLLVCTMPIGFILGLIDIFINDKTKRHIASWFSVCVGGLLIILFIYKKPNEKNIEIENTDNQYTQETILEDESEQEQKETISEIESEQEQKEGLQYSELSESEYKQSCKTLYYDDIFFGDDDLEGQLVKLELFVSEGFYFTEEDIKKSMINDFYNEYNLRRDFYKCCVRHDGENSYVGRQISMFFTEDYQLDYDDFSTGQKITVYAEIVMWSNNTMDGYNTVYIIPRFYE